MTSRTSTLFVETVPAAAFTVFLLVISPVAASGEIDAWAFGLLAVAGLAVGLARRAPLVAFGLALAATCAYLAAGQPDGPIYLAPLVGVVGLIAARPARVWVPAAAVSFLAPAAINGAGDGWTPGLAVGAVVWVGAAVVLARFLRLRAVQLQEAQSRALAEERLRIARDVHDVVGHTLAAISLQAGVAERLLERRPEQAREAVKAIRDLSGQALDEVRAELGVLRGATLTPAAGNGLDAVPGLVAAICDAGADVELDIGPGCDAVPEAVGAAGFRIVQESLTNVVRHAGAQAHTRVLLARNEGALEIEVVDDGRDAPRRPTAGNGMAGMRERALALGGSFVAGGCAQGGFRVWARLPVGPPP